MKKFNITVNGLAYEVEVEEVTVKAALPASAPAKTPAPAKKNGAKAAQGAKAKPQPAAPKQGEGVTAPMPGLVTEILVEVGDTVTDDQTVLILEAMKMENEIIAGKNGVVKEIAVTSGQTVAAGDMLIVLEQ